MKMDFARPATAVAIALAATAVGSEAGARELKVGVGHAAHDLFISKTDGPEQGASITAEVLSNPIEFLDIVGAPRAYLNGAASVDGYTNFLSAGLQWRVSAGRFYADVGAGGAIHDGHRHLPKPDNNATTAENERRIALRKKRIEFGYRTLFHATAAVGYKINDRWAAEFAAQHWSNGHLHSRTNDGTDMLSVRTVYNF